MGSAVRGVRQERRISELVFAHLSRILRNGRFVLHVCELIVLMRPIERAIERWRERSIALPLAVAARVPKHPDIVLNQLTNANHLLPETINKIGRNSDENVKLCKKMYYNSRAWQPPNPPAFPGGFAPRTPRP